MRDTISPAKPPGQVRHWGNPVRPESNPRKMGQGCASLLESLVDVSHTEGAVDGPGLPGGRAGLPQCLAGAVGPAHSALVRYRRLLLGLTARGRSRGDTYDWRMSADPLKSALEAIAPKLDPGLEPLFAALHTDEPVEEAWEALLQEILDEA